MNCEILRSAQDDIARASGSDSALRRRPDKLVHLQLKTNVELVRQDPFHDFARINPAENGREQNGVAAFR